MNIIKSIQSITYQSFGIVIMLIGLGLVVMAFLNSPLQLQIAIGLVGLGFITIGMVQVKRDHDRKKTEEVFDIILAKLDEIQQELKKNEQSKGTGVAIADALSSGLKYYTKFLTKQKKEEDNEG